MTFTAQCGAIHQSQCPQIMSKVIFIVGLPGSGKTSHLQELATEMDAPIFDDFKANAINDNRAFAHGRRLSELVDGLTSGRLCVVADIDFCRKAARSEAEYYLRAAIPDIQVEWWCFTNEPDVCRQNILRNAGNGNRNTEARIRQIEKFSPQYEIPRDAKVLKVWRDSTC